MLIDNSHRERLARKVLSDQGYTEIQITGYDWLACSRDDSFSTGFRAKTKAGHEVKGVVCSDFFKGSTIRIQ